MPQHRSFDTLAKTGVQKHNEAPLLHARVDGDIRYSPPQRMLRTKQNPSQLFLRFRLNECS